MSLFWVEFNPSTMLHRYNKGQRLAIFNDFFPFIVRFSIYEGINRSIGDFGCFFSKVTLQTEKVQNRTVVVVLMESYGMLVNLNTDL